MLRRVYTALLWLLLPLVLLRLLWRSLSASDYRRRIGERLALGVDALTPCDIWLHAVSVGEVQAAEPLVKQLLERGLRLMLTTTTPTGSRLVRAVFGERVAHRYLPLDLPPLQRRFLRALRPRLVVVMETEIWPNMLLACEQAGVPVLLANARLSQRSARGYGRVPGFTAETFGRFAGIAAQGDADRERFIALGAVPERVRVTGSIKFDAPVDPMLRERAEVLRREWGCDRPIWVAASTHEGEDGLLLAAHAQIRKRHPNALLVLVPRHPERFDRVAALARREGFALSRRSLAEPVGTETSVYLGDTMGELPAMIAAADVAFFGGSLVPVGGHNMLEAAAVGVPSVTGPQVFNFSDITRMLREAGGAQMVDNADALAELLGEWLADAVLRERIGRNALAVVERNRGALQNLLDLIGTAAGGA